EFDQLQPEWIRHKGYVQMKMISEKEQDAGSKLSSWKVYYAVLSAGFLLLYKEGHVRSKKSSRSHVPVGSFDLESCHIDPAGKQDTKRKHVFIISTPKKVKLYIQTTSDKEFAAWLDAIMRELVARKENQNADSEIMGLLRSLTIDENHMKVNRKMMGQQQENKGHWFTKSNSGIKKVEPKITAYQQQQQLTAIENDVFGGYLHMEEDGSIPRVVSLCIKEVEERGLKSVGIYRLSGPASTIQKYRNSFNHGKSLLDISLSHEHDINAVTGLLKLYFRELRNPLMTYEYYDWFMEAARISDYEERMYQIKSIIHSLPKSNYIVLECLVRHLNLVATYSDINKMEASNLALIFSVGLLRSPQEDLSSIMMSDLQSKIMEAMIQQVDWFFEEDEEDINDGVEQSTE
ncbi:RhoGAP-domain-containing protein, partial [Backusella circina FSU 941]